VTAPFVVARIDHLVLRARKLERLVSFYANVLGCEVERTVEDAQLVQLRAGSCLIDVVAVQGPLGKAGGDPPDLVDGHNLDHFCLRVDPFDPDRIRAHLGAHGIRASEVRTVYGAEGYGPSIYFDDPEGNTVELKGPTTGAGN
jgi:catechol 2,3-dioxygenase-like lactoylglutathione lyase family enzyme